MQQALRPGESPLHYHVEAGIPIWKLYNNLDQLGLALETMGGSSGQTLAGAVSTGRMEGTNFPWHHGPVEAPEFSDTGY